MIEACSHCANPEGLISDDWGVWHCLDRAACLDRLTGQLAAARTLLGEAVRRIGELDEQLAKSERRSEGLERVVTTHSDALTEIADRLEAEWYVYRGEVRVRRD